MKETNWYKTNETKQEADCRDGVMQNEVGLVIFKEEDDDGR